MYFIDAPPPPYAPQSGPVVDQYGQQTPYAPQLGPVADQSGQQTTFVISQPTNVMTIFGEAPVVMNCPFCLAQIVTRTRYVNGEKVWQWTAFCFIIG